MATDPGLLWIVPHAAVSGAIGKVESFGEQAPLERPARPAELAPAYVLLGSDEASYISGARVAVTGGRPIL